MRMRRRECLGVGAAAGGAALLSGCSQALMRYADPGLPETVELPSGASHPVVRLLNRAGFGPAPGEIERVEGMGASAYIESQLHPDDAEDLGLALRIHRLEALRTDAMELRDLSEAEVVGQLQAADLLRAVYSRHGLRERMVDFWSDHFNIYTRKGLGAYLKPADDLDIIRPNVLGAFPDLLRASAHSPAMLAYLDGPENRRGAPNENYARELMELHTLGAHGGYTQRDVQEVARCMTGWTVEHRFLRRQGRFRFDPRTLHDDGAKKVLGVRIPPGGGQRDGETVLELLAKHPSTAHFLSTKLCRYFLGHAPEARVSRLAAVYLKTNGRIVEMLRPLLLSPDLFDAPPIMKRPFDFVVSALRALGAETDAGRPIQDHLGRMGQPLYQWPMPDGYPIRTAAWTGSLLARWNFSLALTSGAVPGTSLNLPALTTAAGAVTEGESRDALLALILTLPHYSHALRAVKQRLDSAGTPSSPAETAALALASPAFQWR